MPKRKTMRTCYNCNPIHRQLEGEVGRWQCQRTADERVICETPANLLDDSLAIFRALQATQTPEWCPLNSSQGGARPRA